jgi:hypothetical protein
MAKVKSKSDLLQDKIGIFTDSYVSWNESPGSKNRAMATLNKSVGEFSAMRSNAVFNFQDFSNLDTNVSGRPGLTKADYYAFRPGFAPPNPHDYKRIIQACNHSYFKVGLVRNIIDLMGDFACQGVRISHRNKSVEKFYRNWFRRINGAERSERFCNNLFRSGNVVIRKSYAKITANLKKDMQRANAVDIKPTEIKTKEFEIPFKYIFLDPTTIDIAGGALASFVGKPIYTITIPGELRNIILAPRDPFDKMIVAQIPADILNAAKTAKPYPLPPDKTRVFHYKKDDWQLFAYPLLYAVLDDIIMLERLKLADMAALDGAISNLRIFKLGNLEHKIMPSASAASKLSAILQNNTGAGTIDLIWGPDLELIESKTEVHKFLGEGKYKPHLASIYTGLGIPSVFTGGGGSGTTNNFMALKTLIQRLKYGRSILLDFWTSEIAEVQKAMGFAFPAKIEFDVDILDDEQAVRALLIQLVDRNLISQELLQERFGHDPEMEEMRIKREEKERNKGKRPQKAGPYFDAQFGYTLKKIALQQGLLTPEQMGMTNDTPVFDMIIEGKSTKKAVVKQNPGTDKKTSETPLQGRPKNSKDSTKRKTKEFRPSVKGSAAVWAFEAQNKIADILNPLFLHNIAQKKNMRQLTNQEVKNLDIIKFGVLFNLEPYSKISNEVVLSNLGKSHNHNLYNQYQKTISTITSELNRTLTFDEQKQVQVLFYIGNINNK